MPRGKNEGNAGATVETLLRELRAEAQAALKENPSPEIRRRLEAILAIIDGEIEPAAH